MSWLFKSHGDDPKPSSPTGTVKDDLSSLIGRQLRGVAAFLAPPPTPPSDRLSSDSPTQLALLGIRNDLAEISGNFKTGITNFASNFLPFPSNLYEGDKESREAVKEFDQVPGISEEVVSFAVEISTRPGCWTDFPLSFNTEFELSEAQKAHATAIEHLVPELVAVKNEVSSCMDNEQFWLIYFILLMPRLNGHDFELLTTCKVFETRDQLLLKLQKEGGSNKSHETLEEGSSNRETETMEGVIDKIESLKIEQRDTSDESSEERQRSFRDEEDISFSDLDVGELSEKPCSNRSTLRRPSSNASGSSDWVQLSSRSQGGHSKDSEGESSDWLPIDDSN